MKFIKARSKREDGESRLPGINIIDIVLILALVVLVLFAIEYYTSFSFFGAGEKYQMIEYTVELEYVDRDMLSGIEVGDTVRGADGAGLMGQVSSVEIIPETALVYDPEKGTMTEQQLPASADGTAPVTLAIKVWTKAAYESGNGYTVDGSRISVGSPVELAVDGFSGTGICTSIYGIGTDN